MDTTVLLQTPTSLPQAGARPILQRLSAAEWDALAGFVEVRYCFAGETIVSAGETGRAIYFVRSGTVRSADGCGIAVSQQVLGPGAVWGELAFFGGEPLPMALHAHSDVDLWALSVPAFERLAAWHPRIARLLLLDLGRVLSDRLRRGQAWP